MTRLAVDIVTSSRADFGLVRPLIKRFFDDARLTPRLVCLGQASVLADSYLRDGIGRFPVTRPSGRTGRRMRSAGEAAAAVSANLAAFSHHLREGPPDWVLLPGDRFEIVAASLACHYNNQPTAHLFAGDRSVGGHLDDNARHCVSRLASLLLPVSEDSRRRLLRMGEEPWRVHNVGSPVVESVREATASPMRLKELIEPRRHNVLCTYHPIGTEPAAAGAQFGGLIAGLRRAMRLLDVAVIVTHPNNEPGSGDIVRRIAALRKTDGFFSFESLGWRNYLRVMSACDLVVGNSSSALLEAPILGVPALDVGTRQKGRFAPPGVRRVESYEPGAIARAITAALRSPRRRRRHPYGDGAASRRIADLLVSTSSRRSRREILQKRITY